MEGPHWVEVDGIVLPRPIGGHPALDLVNTWAGWRRPVVPPERAEYLKTYDHLVVWATHAGLLDAETSDRLRRRGARRRAEAEGVLHETRALRPSLRAALLDPGDAKAVAVVSSLATRAAAEGRLVAGGQPTWEIGGGLAQPLLRLAWSAAEALTREDLSSVHACPGPECGWLFLDPRGRRRWCSMASCGNRAKVAAHARRERTMR